MMLVCVLLFGFFTMSSLANQCGISFCEIWSKKTYCCHEGKITAMCCDLSEYVSSKATEYISGDDSYISDGSTSNAVIIGGSVGGVVAVIILCVCCCLCCRSQNRRSSQVVVSVPPAAILHTAANP